MREISSETDTEVCFSKFAATIMLPQERLDENWAMFEGYWRG